MRRRKLRKERVGRRGEGDEKEGEERGGGGEVSLLSLFIDYQFKLSLCPIQTNCFTSIYFFEEIV